MPSTRIFSVLKILLLTWSMAAAVAHAAADGGSPRTLSAAEQAFAQAVSTARAIPLAHVTALLGQAQKSERVSKLMQPVNADDASRRPRSWSDYRRRFVDGVRIAKGAVFWRQHRDVLEAAATQYGVPASIIVAIMGVETMYGQHTGNFPVLDTLYTLAFHYPEPAREPRVQLFRDQLADLMALDHAGQLDARGSKGSFAGAVGLPQFMPGSILRFARDGDGDGRIDLYASVADAVASVANFLREHGWQQDLPVFAPVTLPEQAQALAAHGLVAVLDWPQLQAAGASRIKTGNDSHDDGGAAPLWQQHPLGVVPLVDEAAQSTEYRVATVNFYALTQYNRSYFYAAAVADLAQTLEALRLARVRASNNTP